MATLSLVFDVDLARIRVTADTFAVGTTRVEVWRYDTAVLTGAVLVRGGSVDAVSGDTVRLSDYEFTDAVVNTYELRVYAGAVLTATVQDTITPALVAVWLKSAARPFLNRTVTVAGFSDPVAPARGAVFEVLGRRLPVAVGEVRGSRRFEVTLLAADTAEAADIELALSFGDVMFLQPPAGCDVPGPMHVQVGDVTTARRSVRAARRFLHLPLTEVDAPDAAVVGYTATNAGILAAFATCADVLAAFATCVDLLEYVSAPVDEVVG